MTKYFVVCPGNTVTGGPELLHQLVDALNKQGADAYILYHPFDVRFEIPKQYSAYEVKQGKLEDVQSNNLFLSETNTAMAAKFPNASINIWWLSVDFYLGVYRESMYSDALRYLWNLALKRAPIYRLKKYVHWAQSNYAKEFLEKKGIASKMLSDYLNPSHEGLENEVSPKKEDIILYNPKKGRKRTEKLISEYPKLSFIPIKDMTAEEVSKTLRAAKIYIDFGHHPGKDRLPREAAAAGCCVISGRHGAAENLYDLPIGSRYKLNDRGPDYVKEFGDLAEDIFKNFDTHVKNFESIKRKISREKEVFFSEVRELIKAEKTEGLSE